MNTSIWLIAAFSSLAIMPGIFTKHNSYSTTNTKMCPGEFNYIYSAASFTLTKKVTDASEFFTPEESMKTNPVGHMIYYIESIPCEIHVFNIAKTTDAMNDFHSVIKSFFCISNPECTQVEKNSPKVNYKNKEIDFRHMTLSMDNQGKKWLFHMYTFEKNKKYMGIAISLAANISMKNETLDQFWKTLTIDSSLFR